MKKSIRRIRLLPIAFCVVASALAIWFVWTMAKGHLELGGSHPDTAQLATIQSVAQRATEGFCDNILVTPEATWLVGVTEDRRRDLDIPDNATDLATRLGRDSEKDTATTSMGLMYGSGSDDRYAYISRLEDDGRFHLVAHIDSAACLVASPDGNRVFVLSGKERPDDDYENTDPASHQDAVFVSDDQGASWSWQRDGFMVPSSPTAWAVEPYTDNYGTVWAWASLPRSGTGISGPILDGDGSGLYYSTDEGHSTTEVTQSGRLMLDTDQLTARLPDDMQLSGGMGLGEIEPYVIRLGADRAAIWVSQQHGYYNPDDDSPYIDGLLRITHYAALTKRDGQWHMGPVRQREGLTIQTMDQAPDGRVRMVIRQSDHTNQQIAKIDPETLEIAPLGDVPSAFSPLDSSAYIRGFRVGAQSMVINVSSTYTVPKWLNIGEWLSGDEAHISGDAVFYSTDDGQSWDKLGVRGFRGILGFDPATDRLFWSEKPFYEGGTSIEVDHLAGG